MAKKVKVSVIMPAYNEEEWISECFHRVVKVLNSYRQPFEIILEEDGSTDRTPQIIDELARRYPFVKALHFPRRMGKGFGVRMGLKASMGDFVVLLDSDMEYPPEKIPALLDGMDSVDIAVGGRMDRRKYKTEAWRRLSSIAYILLLKLLFKTDELHDPQSGFKAYKRKVIEAVSPLTSDGFEIDTEILIKAVKKGYKLRYVPVTYTFKGNSKVDMLRDPFRMLLSVLRWRLDGKFKTKGNERLKQEYQLHRRRLVEDDALKIDHAKTSYESKNPLVRTFFNKKIEVILEYASKDKRQHILDVGCGDGAILEKLPGELLVGVDLSLTRLKRARSKVKNASFVCGDAEHLPFKSSSFDMVTCFDVLEHLSNPLNCVNDIESSTRRGGAMLVSIPEEIALSVSRFFTLKYPFSLKGYTHVLSLSPKEVVGFFKKSELLSIRRVPTRVFPVITLLLFTKMAKSSIEG